MDGVRAEGLSRTEGAHEVFPHQVRLFGAAYRMYGSACEADEAVRHVLTRVAHTGEGDALPLLFRELFGRARTVPEQAVRHRREAHAGSWLPEPVLTDGGALGDLDTAESRE